MTTEPHLLCYTGRMSTNQASFITHMAHNAPYFDETIGDWAKTPTDPDCEHCQTTPLLKDIHAVWTSGNTAARVILYSIQDGYGEPGFVPEQGFDWSGIRDSSPAAVRKMHAAIHA